VSPPQSSAAHPDTVAHPVRGIALLVCAVSCFAVMEAVVKVLASRNPVGVIVWARYFFNMVLLLVFMGPGLGAGLLRTHRPGLQWLRGAILGVSSVCFFAGLPFLPLAEAASLTAIGPILVALLAVRLLGERAPPGTAWALLASFLGVLLIVRPGGAVFTWAALLPLGSALCYAAYQILTRRLSTIDDGRVTQFYGALGATLLLTAPLPWFWQMPERITDIALMVAVGGLGGLGHLLLVRALKLAPASLLAPFAYVHIVMSLALGLLVFGAMPDAIALSGMALIVGTGVVMALRQRREQISRADQAARERSARTAAGS
jgi:drug/metabolite transporter (DMT)-like permease